MEIRDRTLCRYILCLYVWTVISNSGSSVDQPTYLEVSRTVRIAQASPTRGYIIPLCNQGKIVDRLPSCRWRIGLSAVEQPATEVPHFLGGSGIFNGELGMPVIC